MANILQLCSSLCSGGSFISISRYRSWIIGLVSDILGSNLVEQIYHTEPLALRLPARLGPRETCQSREGTNGLPANGRRYPTVVNPIPTGIEENTSNEHEQTALPDILMTMSQIPDVNRELAEVGAMFAAFDVLRRNGRR